MLGHVYKSKKNPNRDEDELQYLKLLLKFRLKKLLEKKKYLLY